QRPCTKRDPAPAWSSRTPLLQVPRWPWPRTGTHLGQDPSEHPPLGSHPPTRGTSVEFPLGTQQRGLTAPEENIQMAFSKKRRSKLNVDAIVEAHSDAGSTPPALDTDTVLPEREGFDAKAAQDGIKEAEQRMKRDAEL